MKFCNILRFYLNSQEGNVTFSSLCLITVQIGKLMKLCSRGHVAIIVNVASKCGLTATNYKELAELHDQFAESKGLRILAFPCNQFNGQVRLTRVLSVLRNKRLLGLVETLHSSQCNNRHEHCWFKASCLHYTPSVRLDQ